MERDSSGHSALRRPVSGHIAPQVVQVESLPIDLAKMQCLRFADWAGSLGADGATQYLAGRRDLMGVLRNDDLFMTLVETP